MSLQEIKEAMNRFSFAQMTSNQDGKTSASGTMGVLICTISAVCFLIGTLQKNTEVLLQSVILTGIGSGLLGFRKHKEAKKVVEEESIEAETEQPLNS